MTNDSKYRNFWISPAYRPEDEDRISFCKVPKKDFEHVIEISALQDEREKTKELVSFLKRLSEAYSFDYGPAWIELNELIKKYGGSNE